MKLKSRSGLTLIEIMVSAIVMTIAVIAIIGIFNNTMVLNEFNRERTVAMTHAQCIMEEIKNAGFAGLETNINNNVWDRTQAQLSASPYNLTVLFNESVDTAVVTSGDPLRISVTVNWQDHNSNPRTTTIQTLKTNGS